MNSRLLVSCALSLATALAGFAIGLVQGRNGFIHLPGAPGSAPVPLAAPPRSAPRAAGSARTAIDQNETRPVAREAAESDSSESLETILSFPSALHRTVALKAFFDAVSPAQFATLLHELQRRDITGEPIDMLFRLWGEKAPAEGKRAALSFPAGPARIALMGAFTRAWARRDPEGARQFAMDHLTGAEREFALNYLRTIVPQPTRTLPEILAMTDLQARTREMQRYFTEAGQSNPAAALAQARKLETSEDEKSMVAHLFYSWAAKDPEAALRWAEAERKSGRKLPTGWVPHTSFTQLATKSPERARAFVDSMDHGIQRDELEDILAGQLLRRDPAAAFQYVEERTAANPNATTRVFFATWFAIDPANAAPKFHEEIARRYPGDAVKKAAPLVAETIHNWAAKDPRAAAEFAARFPASALATLFGDISAEWCRADGAAATQWATELPQGAARDEALRQFTYTWAKHDTSESTAWLEQLPPDSGRWAATEGLVFSVIDTDPDAALGWVRSIPDENKRLNILRRAWRSWSRDSAESARDWKEHASLTAAERKTLSGGAQ